MLKSLEQKFLHSFWKTPLFLFDEVSDGCEEAALGFDEVPAVELLIVIRQCLYCYLQGNWN